jgi:hypothetical protein
MEEIYLLGDWTGKEWIQKWLLMEAGTYKESKGVHYPLQELME